MSKLFTKKLSLEYIIGYIQFSISIALQSIAFSLTAIIVLSRQDKHLKKYF